MSVKIREMSTNSSYRLKNLQSLVGRTLPVVLALTLCLTLGANAPAPVAESIQQLLDSPSASGAIWGVYVQDLQTGEVLYSYNAEKALLPASNQKLLTSAAALDVLGPGFRYKTRLHFSGEVQGPVMRGDLIVVGSGDPTLGSIEMRGEDPLRTWARSLAQAGVQQIEGRLIGDDDAFDNQPYAEGWDIDYVVTQSSRSIGVSAGGLSYNDNVIEVQIESAQVGEPPQIRMRPAGYLEVVNRAETSNRQRGWLLDLRRNFGSETILLEGSIPRSYVGTVAMPVNNPTTFTLHAFKEALQEAGIQVQAEVIDIDDMPQPPDYDRTEMLFVHFSPTLAEILTILNKESNNFYAEQVFRSMAYGGSANGGERRVIDLLSKAGVSDPNISVRDGSGLSRKDLVTPHAMVSLLGYMAKHQAREAFFNSLAQGGEARTTLRGRLGNVPVQAKTGTLEYVSALSGYSQTVEGHPVAFAVFANHFTGPSYQITQVIDQIIRTVAQGTAPPEG
jgi:serine-type D-Ala-D-Ala carboxypeptidase/endopeptidase (penicillin-binding protein 4)